MKDTHTHTQSRKRASASGKIERRRPPPQSHHITLIIPHIIIIITPLLTRANNSILPPARTPRPLPPQAIEAISAHSSAFIRIGYARPDLNVPRIPDDAPTHAGNAATPALHAHQPGDAAAAAQQPL